MFYDKNNELDARMVETEASFPFLFSYLGFCYYYIVPWFVLPSK